MKPQPKKSILEFLKNIYPEWRSGAYLEDQQWGGKKSCTGRALRRLYSEGKVEHKYEPLEYRNDTQVWYRYLPETKLQEALKCPRTEERPKYEVMPVSGQIALKL